MRRNKNVHAFRELYVHVCVSAIDKKHWQMVELLVMLFWFVDSSLSAWLCRSLLSYTVTALLLSSTCTLPRAR